MTLDEKIQLIKKCLEKRSKEAIISDICDNIDDHTVDNIAWMFDIYLDD